MYLFAGFHAFPEGSSGRVPATPPTGPNYTAAAQSVSRLCGASRQQLFKDLHFVVADQSLGLLGHARRPKARLGQGTGPRHVPPPLALETMQREQRSAQQRRTAQQRSATPHLPGRPLGFARSAEPPRPMSVQAET